MAVTFLALAVISGLNLAAVARRFPPVSWQASAAGVDVVMRHERRMAAVRTALQQRGIHGAIGYVSEVPPADLPAKGDAMQEYFLTQFALAPWVIEAKFDDCAWAVANFHELGAPVPVDFRVVQDFGAGVALLQKSPR